MHALTSVTKGASIAFAPGGEGSLKKGLAVAGRGMADGWVDACVGIGEGAGEMYRGARGKETRLSSTASAKLFAPLERELKEMKPLTRSARPSR